MINEIKLLTLLELRNLYGINVFLKTKDKKEKRKTIAMMMIWLLVGGVICFYMGGLVFGLCFLNMGHIVPAYLTILASLFILFLGILKPGNGIFGKKGYDMLSSLPLRTGAVVGARFLVLYVQELILTLLVMLPGILVYGILLQPSVGFYLVMTFGILVVPLLPLVISVGINSVITAISARMKNKSLVQTMLSILLILFIICGSFKTKDITQGFSEEMLQNMLNGIGEVIGRIYPPAMWISKAAIEGKGTGFLFFCFLSLLAVILMIAVIGKYYHAICRRLFATSAKHDYKMETLKSNSMLWAFYQKECRRYFASSIYVSNTIMGPILSDIMAAALLIVGMEPLMNVIPAEMDIACVIPFLFSAVCTMMTTTSVSISMEGKEIWIMKSLPVSSKTVWDSKILWNLSLILPAYFIAEVCMMIAVKPNVGEALFFLCIPVFLILFAVVFGITINLKFHNFDWTKEESVVKQSISSLIGGMAGFFVSIILGIVVLLLPTEWKEVGQVLISVGLLGVTVFLYGWNNRVRLEAHI